MTERDIVHALNACHLITDELGWERLAAMALNDQEESNRLYREQQRCFQRAAYWRNRLRTKQVPKVIIEEWSA